MFTDWAKTPSVTRGDSALGSGVPDSEVTPVTQSPYSGQTAIAAWHCVSSVNTDNSQKTGSSQSYNSWAHASHSPIRHWRKPGVLGETKSRPFANLANSNNGRSENIISLHIH